MRATVTIDATLELRLRGIARRQRISYEAAIDAAIRAGLALGADGQRPYRETVRAIGVRPGVDLTKALALVATLDDASTIQRLEDGGDASWE